MYSQRGAEGGLDNKNRLLNAVITIQLRSQPHFQFRSLHGLFCLELDWRDEGLLLPDYVIWFGGLFSVSVIRCSLGVFSGNDELDFL